MGIEKISAMSDREKEEFAKVCNSILACTFVLRDGKDGKISREYLYIERNFDVISDYLQLTGWRLYKNTQYGVISVVNVYGNNRVRLDKLTTLFLVILRIIYEEKRAQASSVNDVCITVSEVLQKLVNEYSLYPKKPPQKELKTAFRLLEEHNLIQKLDESYEDYQCRIIICPSVLIAVSNEKTKLICDKLKEETEESADEEDNEIIVD